MDPAIPAWLTPHTRIYSEILENLKGQPVTGTAVEFLDGRALQLLSKIFECWVYKVDDSGKKVMAFVKDGTPAVFWDGRELGLRPYNAKEHALWDYAILAKRIKRLATKDTLIVDIGAGTSLQAIILRVMGCDAPILSLEMFMSALEIGKTICSSLGLKDIYFGAANLTNPEGLRELGKMLPSDRPMIVISRHVLYPFFNEQEFSRLFDYLIRERKVAAGVHLERVGRFTPTFLRIQEAYGSTLKTPPKHEGVTDDPIQHLFTRPDITVGEHHEVWPHFINTYFPRYLQWTRKP